MDPSSSARIRFAARLAIVLALAGSTACGAPPAPTPTTGLTGTVTRGPITPVCQPNADCDAPFSAGFTVADGAGQTTLAHFQSDANGRFTVLLGPGPYRIVPDADAPILSPASQVKPVTVGPAGLTSVQLQFDTGIR